MSDPQEPTPDGDGPVAETSPLDRTSEEIARSLATVWRDFSGQRPKSTNVEIGKDVVRCRIEEGKADVDADEDGDASGDPKLSKASFGFNATSAVARITGRRVVGFIPKRDKKTEISTQTFILRRERRKF
jgi:hypothetical protein